jgi:hypothetical protein
MVDTAADDVVFPMRFTTLLGANLDRSTQRHAASVGSRQLVGLMYAPMVMEVRDSLQVCRWRAVVAFTAGKMLFPLFGIAGGLQYFRTTFDVDGDEIILDPKPSLPATQATVP